MSGDEQRREEVNDEQLAADGHVEEEAAATKTAGSNSWADVTAQKPRAAMAGAVKAVQVGGAKESVRVAGSGQQGASAEVRGREYRSGRNRQRGARRSSRSRQRPTDCAKERAWFARERRFGRSAIEAKARWVEGQREWLARQRRQQNTSRKGVEKQRDDGEREQPGERASGCVPDGVRVLDKDGGESGSGIVIGALADDCELAAHAVAVTEERELGEAKEEHGQEEAKEEHERWTVKHVDAEQTGGGMMTSVVSERA